MEILSLLRSKNRCLQRLLHLSEQFASELEKKGLESLEQFQAKREAIMKALELYDRKVAEVATTIPSEKRTPSLIQDVRKILAQKEELVSRIMKSDQKIISRIEQEEEEILKEMTLTKKAGGIVKKFKSNWVSSSGEEIDRKL